MDLNADILVQELSRFSRFSRPSTPSNTLEELLLLQPRGLNRRSVGESFRIASLHPAFGLCLAVSVPYRSHNKPPVSGNVTVVASISPP